MSEFGNRISQAMASVESGTSAREISRHLGVSRKAIRRRIKNPNYVSGRTFGSDASATPSDIDFIWAAGFLEGEGCFHKSIQASQVNKEPLEKLFLFWGGTLKLRIRSYTYKEVTSKRHFWAWRISGNNGRKLARRIYEFMSERRKKQMRRFLIR